MSTQPETSLLPVAMPFAILRCSNKACRKVVRGDVTRSVDEFGRRVIFVGALKVGPWNGTLQASCFCGKGSLIGKRVVGTHSEKLCGAKCLGATGPSCDCSCGGKNHGGAHC